MRISETILTLTLAFLVNINGGASVWNVCGECPIKSITSAVAHANAGDTIIVHPGTYREHDISITRPLKIWGIDMPVIDGNKLGEIFTIKSDSVDIAGLKIINVGTSYTRDFAAIRFIDCQYFSVRDCHLEHLFFGIFLQKSSHGVIENNVIKGNAVDEFSSGNGLHFWYSHNISVKYNEIFKTRDGIYLEFSDSIYIDANLSEGNLRYGLHFMFSNYDVYSKNTFRNNGAGVAVMFSKGILMDGNLFVDNWGPTAYGLLLKEMNDAEIINNHFIRNTTGIHTEGSNRITYRGNLFESNGWAVKVLGACYDNHFIANNFISNSFDVAYTSKSNNNSFKGNYWSAYVGYDLNKDGRGDQPHRPVKLFSYIVNRTPESIVLLRSLFIDLLNLSEQVSPVFTPDDLKDNEPAMKRIP